MTTPRILHVAHTDTLGGAARAAFRLHNSLCRAGVESRMLVGWKRSTDPTVHAWGSQTTHRIRAYGDRLLTRMAGGDWSNAWSNNRFPRRPFSFEDGWTPQVVNLHWVWGGFASLRSLELWRVPYVWTMHDMAALTGGCHYAGDCEKFTRLCGECPQLNGARKSDRSTSIQAERVTFAERVHPVVVAPSRWMAKQAASSTAYKGARVVTIPNGLRADELRPLDRAMAREHFGLPATCKVIAFGAIAATTDLRKGYDLLLAALSHLARLVPPSSVRILVFGGANLCEHWIHGFNCHEVGTLCTEEKLALAYSAADVFVAPSRQDNLPNTLIESLACGTPGVGFAIGGIPEIITQGETGWLAPAFQPEALAQCLRSALDRAGDPALREACRLRAQQCYSEEQQVKDYMGLYASLFPT